MANKDDCIIRGHYFILGYFKAVKLPIQLIKINHGKIYRKTVTKFIHCISKIIIYLNSRDPVPVYKISTS